MADNYTHFDLFHPQGISRDSSHKRRKTGGHMVPLRKKRKVCARTSVLDQSLASINDSPVARIQPLVQESLAQHAPTPPFPPPPKLRTPTHPHTHTHTHTHTQFELGRPPAMTKIGPKRIHTVRCMGGNQKFRALRLETGNFSWGSEAVTRKARILGVVYNASNNELVRTNTLVKNCIIQIDATPFRQVCFPVVLRMRARGVSGCAQDPYRSHVELSH